MKIAITGGKGGTGKSTIATALAYKIAKKHKVLLLDLDVDCPDDDLILGIKMKKVKDVETMIPKFDYEKCIKCGLCINLCPIENISMSSYPVFDDRCVFCMRCISFCPTEAIYIPNRKLERYHVVKAGELLNPSKLVF